MKKEAPMPIHKSCRQCHKIFTVSPARAETARFCSAACRQAGSRTAERREIACEACGDAFVTTADHGVWPRFCSRECLYRQCIQPKEKLCATCGCLFVAARTSHSTEDGLRKYCSNACRHKGLERGDEYQCLNCNTPFYLNAAAVRQRAAPGCCSKECSKAFYTDTRSASFKRGFYTHKQMGEKHLLLPRPGYVGKYVGEHRVVASREIGRMVKRGEIVIRVNRNPSDNRPENLFICESMSEFCKRRAGTLPWPRKSNLMNYAVRVHQPSEAQ